MSQLDPHPLNELGKGLIEPDTEAQLIGQGVVFAMRVFHDDGHMSLALFSRPAVETLEAARDHGARLITAMRKEQTIRDAREQLRPELAAAG